MQRLGSFPSRQHRSFRLRTIVLGCVALVTLAIFVFYGSLHFFPSLNHGDAGGVAPWTLRQAGPLPVTTLVIYIFSNTDPEYIENLRFFAEYGMEEGDGCEYIVIVQDDKDKTLPELPALPANARYVHHENRCYDWGTIGWLLQSGQVDTSPYTYFIFMNSSVRGPFLAPYARKLVRWQHLLTHKLNDRVKLVGPTISCEGSPYQGNVGAEWRTNPHVQSYVVATDQVGLQVWLQDENVFKCWDSMWDVIWHGELGSSLAMLNAGYNLDCFMARYQGVSWLDKKVWECNQRANPYGEYYNDGISLSPYEVLFVKVKEKVLQNDWSFSVQAKKYARYIAEQARGQQEVVSNEYRANPRKFHLQRLGYLLQRGPECFDHVYYLKKNPDLSHYQTKPELWGHFLRGGAYEGRSYVFTCPASNIQAPE